MPNHVSNEVTLTGLNEDQVNVILASLINSKGEVDFELLLPLPLNIWWGNVGTAHEKAFRAGTALEWCADNWSTKWNAYGQKPVEIGADGFTIRFDTAWGPPMGWLCAIFNRFKVGFEYHYLSEGENHGHSGKFSINPDSEIANIDWVEGRCSDDMQKHLHMLRWGVESFDDEAEE